MKEKKINLLLALLLTGFITMGQNTVPKKPLYELFTSSTCGPCAAQNPYLDAVLADNPGEYSLIKYQMDWPGNGDPYYIADGGIRKNYYGVTGVPSLWINSENLSPVSSITQEIFDSYIGETTSMEINLTASINSSNLVSINAEFSALAAYNAGLTAHIAVIEKVTTENISTNGEVEFYNVLMAMYPDGNGTTLNAFTGGDSQTINASIDMSNTFMEQGNDLAVIVFVQDNSTHNITQSEMIDVDHPFTDYSVTFNIEDSEGNLVEGAEIFMEMYGTIYTNASGTSNYEGVLPGEYNYEIKKAGLYPTTGTLEVVDENITESIVLEMPAYYFYEDFETEIPASWTVHSTTPDFLYHYDGKVIFFKQSTGTEPIMLVSPEIDLAQAEFLMFSVGEAAGNATIHIGTVSDPADPSTFTVIANYAPGADWEEHTINLTEQSISDGFLAFSLVGEAMNFFSFDNVKLTEFIPVPTYSVTFNIVNGNQEPIEGATVTFNEVIQNTNASGQAIFADLLEGNYDYTVEDENAITINQNISLNADLTITEELSYIGIKEIEHTSIRVFPNPAKNIIQVVAEIEAKYKIFNLCGEQLVEGKLSSSNNEISVEALKNGMYIIELSNEKFTETNKFTILK